MKIMQQLLGVAAIATAVASLTPAASALALEESPGCNGEKVWCQTVATCTSWSQTGDCTHWNSSSTNTDLNWTL